MPLPAVPPSANSSSTKGCFGCGLDNAHAICSPSPTLFTSQHTNSATTINHFISSSLETRAAATRVIEDGESKLDMIQTAIRRLQAHAANITHVNRQNRRFLITILVLPDDILLLVFEHLSVDRDLGSWIVSAVCKRWRSVALSCSTLWTRITFGEQYRNSFSRALANLERRLEIQLTRAGDRDIQLRFDTTRASGAGLWRPSPAAVLFPQPYASRYSTLQFYGDVPHNWKAFGSPSFPALRRLSVYHISWIQTPFPFNSIKAPMLSDLTIGNVALVSVGDVNIERLKFPGLRRLAFRSCTFAEPAMARLLQINGQLLEALEYTNQHTTSPYDVPASHPYATVALPNLRHLSCASNFANGSNRDRGTFDSADSPFLGKLHTPLLRSLQLSKLFRDDLHAVKQLVRNSNNMPQLKELVVEEWSGTTTLLITLLSDLPSLESLSLKNIQDVDDLTMGLHVKTISVVDLLEKLHWRVLPTFHPAMPPPDDFDYDWPTGLDFEEPLPTDEGVKWAVDDSACLDLDPEYETRQRWSSAWVPASMPKSTETSVELYERGYGETSVVDTF